MRGVRYAASMPRVNRDLAPLLAAVLLSGCAAEPARTVPAPAVSTPPVAARSTELVAMVDGVSIGFGELRPSMVESAGTAALRDRVVDVRLSARLKSAGIAVDAAMVAREEAVLLETLDPKQDRARELLLEIRGRQGLGEVRFAALLRRNAGLRALVAPAIRIDDEGVENIFDSLHGAKRTARIAVVASLSDAERFAAEVPAKGFATLAAERSSDGSAARGGLLAPIARRDPSYPETVRAAIFATAVGTTSAPVLDGSRFFIVEVIGETPADGTPRESVRAECERLLRLSRERLMMDALARELASLDGVTVFDRSFDAR